MISPRGQASGFALVMVLIALAVMSLLLLAVFGGAAHQIRGTQGDASFTREKMLSDTAAALVIGQIQHASTQTNQAWISQPGLLRTYTATSTRTPSASYKLYSSPQMIDTSGSLAFLSTEIPSDWNSAANASVYTDLNAPMSSSSGNSLYPILDAGAVNKVTGLTSDAGHTVEMPVAWLYELQDGTLGSPSAATKTNPIVGRIAFWTDDETSKIDINTAGEGSPWNTPRAYSADDVAWTTTQPAAGEFSRYPGHPAGISLSTVFGTNAPPDPSPDQLLAMTPRYGSGGSDFGTLTTTATSAVSPKTDRLYASIDELCFSSTLNTSGQRVPNPITPAELNLARFVLTAHSHSPETTLLGEPRVAIWPVSDAPTDSTHTTAADRAVESAATVGTGTYFFQRHNAASATDDLDPAIVPGNVTLFNNLIASGDEILPGYGSKFSQKYPGAQWPQIVIETLDAIRGFNAIDPATPPLTPPAAPNSFIPFAAGDKTGVGRGLIVPLTETSGISSLRGLGRYPTLFGLTLVLYVSGYQFTDGTFIDYEKTPDYQYPINPATDGASWKANFTEALPPASRWNQVSAALVRAFVVPTTFQPGCGYPEVSDACDIQISGLDKLTMTVATKTSTSPPGDFGFPAVATSRLLSDALSVPPADRSWGGFEGPLAWRAAALDAMGDYTRHYDFAGTNAFVVPLPIGSDTAGPSDPKTKGPSLPSSWNLTLTTSSPNLSVAIRDHLGATIQTLAVTLPSLSCSLPMANGEADHYDGATPETSTADWASNANNKVLPSYYMTLRNRLLATQRSRPLMIQAGDASISVEAQTDLRMIAAMANVPATYFGPSATDTTTPAYKASLLLGGMPQHNLRFGDGTSAAWMSMKYPELVTSAYASTATNISVINWNNGQTVNYPWIISPASSAPTGTKLVSMAPVGNSATAPAGDWDTGPGLEPDGALMNLPDAGTTLDPTIAYESLSGGQFGAATLRSPNALIPSPVVFGSLPAGINPDQPALSQPWRTLLFCPYPSSDQLHPGLATPPDYLWLDRFWMPVVEPYGISTRMETAGKINLNDQIAPFTYLHRSTALHALLHGLRIPAISPAFASSFKTVGTKPIATIWKTVDEDATVQQIETRFSSGDAYLTEGEICSVPLVPTGILASSLESFWTSRTSGAGALTGDNLRELPYAQLYSRLTTKSNSYTVHMRVQVLQKVNDGSAPNVWREGMDRVLGDWRGSYEIERYLDPSASAPAASQPLGPYKFRVVSAQRFTP